MTNPTTLLALAARCEVVHEADRELNAEIHCAVNGYVFLGMAETKGGYRHDWPKHNIKNSVAFVWPAYTGSLDAAVTLIPPDFFMDLHDWTWAEEPRWNAHLRKTKGDMLATNGQAPTAPLAITAAALRARAGGE